MADDHDNSGERGGGPGGAAGALLRSMRPAHWVKNAFVAAPILFAMPEGRFGQVWAWGQCAMAVVSFCLVSSAIYLINDVCDRRQDRAHPIKRLRPVASGRLSRAGALVAAAAVGGAGVAAAALAALRAHDPAAPLHGLGVLVWVGAYVVMNLLYSLWLKARPVVDVIVIALGFVLRAMAGADAIAAPISPWLAVCTFTLCLFVALTKRRSELAALPDAAEAAPAGRWYDTRDIEHMLTVSAALAILTYSLYCLAPRTIDRIHSAHMVWTIPLVTYGMFRFNHVTRQAAGRDPVAVLLCDKAMWAVLVAYVVLTGLILAFGGHPAVRGILDVKA